MTASLCVCPTDGLGDLPNVAYICLQYASEKVHQRVASQPGTYANLLGLGTVATKRTNLNTDDDIASPMYARLELIKYATDLRKEADKSLRLAQIRYKKYYHGRVLFAPILGVGVYVFVDRSSIFRSDAERSSSGKCDKL